MLDAEYLSRVSEGAEAISEQLHNYIIKQIVSRMIERLGRGESYLLTSADAWRIRMLQDAGYLLSDITAEIAKYTKLQQAEIAAAMIDAGVKAITTDNLIYQAAGLSPEAFEQSPNLVRLAERNMNATLGEWQNFTRTTAEAAQRLFINECDKAYNNVMSGAVSYAQAVSEALDNIVSDGVIIEYPTGHRDTIETATARAVRTGISQATGDISIERMKEMDWDIILVSAHVGARTGDGGENAGNHSWWQGKFYSRTGQDDRFPPFSVTGYGTGEGLCGWNCRHSFGSGDGINNPYEELRELDDEDAGKTYQAEQRQRALERRIRKTKREVMGMQNAVDGCRDADLKEKLQSKLDRKSATLQRQTEAYNDYCRQNNLRTQADRLKIAQWDRENAAKARGAARRYANRGAV